MLSGRFWHGGTVQCIPTTTDKEDVSFFWVVMGGIQNVTLYHLFMSNVTGCGTISNFFHCSSPIYYFICFILGTMGLLVACGTKSSVSSRSLPPITPEEDEYVPYYGSSGTPNDRDVLFAEIDEQVGPWLGLQVSSIRDSHCHEESSFSRRETLQALLSVRYYPMKDVHSKTIHHWVAECWIQVTPATEPISMASAQDDTVRIHRIQVSSPPPPTDSKLQILFSENRNSLVCLLPDGTLAIFRLRRTTLRLRQPQDFGSFLPRPTYVAASPLDTPSTLTTTHLLRVLDFASLDPGRRTVTAVADSFTFPNKNPNHHPQIMLLMGCSDGSLWVYEYYNEEDSQSNEPLGKIVWKPEEEDEEDSVLHISVTKDKGSAPHRVATCSTRGVCRIFAVQEDLLVELARFDPEKLSNAVSSLWVSPHHVAVLSCVATDAVLQVYSVYDDCKVQVWGQPFKWNESIISEQRSNKSDSIQSFDCRLKDETAIRSSPPHHLQFDWSSGSIIVNGQIRSSRRIEETIVFSCVWDWHRNVRSLALVARTTNTVPFSRLTAVHGPRGEPKLIHCYTRTRNDTTRITKEVYEAGIMSPSSQVSPKYRSTSVFSSGLFLTSKTVSFPSRLAIPSTSGYEAGLEEVQLPTEYLNQNGIPGIAACGRRKSRSVAIAGSSGFCTFSDDRQLENARAAGKRRKWHIFSDRDLENPFSVDTFSWWEIDSPDSSRNMDLLLVVLRARDGRRYLSCWAHGHLSLENQLLRQEDGNPLGLPLDDRFESVYIDVYGTVVTENMGRRGTLLIADDSDQSNFSVFLIEATPRNNSFPWPQVKVSPILTDSVGAPCHLFVASACRDLDIVSSDEESPNLSIPKYVAVICSIHRCTRHIDALAVTSAGIVAIGSLPLLSPKTGNSLLRVESIWLEDTCTEVSPDGQTKYSDRVSWVFLSDLGTMYQWSLIVPKDKREFPSPDKDVFRSGSSQTNLIEKFSWVNSSFPIFGTFRRIGTTLTWMLLSNKTTSTDILLGSVFDFGYTFSVGVDTQKIDVSSTGRSSAVHLHGTRHLSARPPLACVRSYMFMAECNVGDTKGHGCFEMVTSMDGLVTSIQLLILRLVELVAVSIKSAKENTDRMKELRQILESSRSLLSPARFLSLLVEIARQLEPAFLEVLFPMELPSGLLSLDTLFNEALSLGSLSLAVSILPLTKQKSEAVSRCGAVFDFCLYSILSEPGQNDFPNNLEEKRLVSSLFHFGVRLDETFYIHELSNGSIEDNVESRGYSLFCGIPSLFRRAKPHPRRKQRIPTKMVQGKNSGARHGGTYDYDENSLVPVSSPSLQTAEILLRWLRYIFIGNGMQEKELKRVACLCEVLVWENSDFGSKNDLDVVVKEFDLYLERGSSIVAEKFQSTFVKFLENVDQAGAERTSAVLATLVNSPHCNGIPEDDVMGLHLIAVAAGAAGGSITQERNNLSPRLFDTLASML